MTTLAIALLAYLLGSIPFAVVSSKLFGLADPRSYGSGNPGATNVLRSGSKAAALVTVLGDAAKGWLAVYLAQHLGPAYGAQPQDIPVAGFAAFFGHLHPVFLGFRGGKGVATAAGVMLGFSPWLGLSLVAVFALVVWLFRYASLGSIATAIIAPILGMMLIGPGETLTAIFCIALLIFWRHSANLQRIRAGTEPKIGEKKAPAA